MRPIGFLGTLLLFLVTAVIFIYIPFRFADAIEANSEVQICRDSTLLSARQGPRGIKCPEREVKVTDKDKITKTLADETTTCWHQFSAGKLDLFGETPEGEIKTFCAVCARIVFEDNAKNQKVDDYVKYLMNNPAKPAYVAADFDTNNRMSMWQYIRGVQSENEELLAIDNQITETNFEIDTSVDYATVYVHSKLEPEVWLTEGESTAIDIAIGGSLATKGAAALVFLIPGVGQALGGIVLISGAVATYYVATETGEAIDEALDVVAPPTEEWNAGVMLVPYQTANFRGLNCDYFPISQDVFGVG